VTGDEVLSKAFMDGRDIHAQTAANMYAIDSSQVTPEQRNMGKRINFSVLYGLTPFSLAKELGISPSEAKKYITAFFDTYPSIKPWMETVVDGGIKNGFVTTPMGRKRWVPGLTDRNRMVQDAAKRVAVNTVIQGAAAEIIKQAMIVIAGCLKNSPATLLLQVHDELIFEVETSSIEVITKQVSQMMSGVVNWDVPLPVTLRSGINWGGITK
jgi:DNA polymerase-1